MNKNPHKDSFVNVCYKNYWEKLFKANNDIRIVYT